MLWARRSADLGNSGGEHNVGLFYANGWGVLRNLSTAVQWFERAAKQGDRRSAQALRNLAADGVPEAAAALRRIGLAR